MSTTPASPTPSEITALPARPGRDRGPTRWIVLAVVAVVAVAGILFATLRGGVEPAAAADRVAVKVGTTEASADYWPVLVDLAAKENIDIQLVNFTDYTQADPALSQGQIDLNLFQHLLFLANYNVANSDTLTPIGATVVVPLGVYSSKHTDLAQIPAGGQVSIPNDATNQARALLVLQQAGLISLTGGGNPLSTPADIDTAASKVSVTPVDAAQTVASLPSVDAAVINNNFALDADLDPSKALYNDDPASPAAEPYINAFVARADQKDNPTYLRIAQLYHDPSVTAAVVAASKDTAVIVDRPAADLGTILGGLETVVRDAS